MLFQSAEMLVNIVLYACTPSFALCTTILEHRLVRIVRTLQSMCTVNKCSQFGAAFTTMTKRGPGDQFGWPTAADSAVPENALSIGRALDEEAGRTREPQIAPAMTSSTPPGFPSPVAEAGASRDPVAQPGTCASSLSDWFAGMHFYGCSVELSGLCHVLIRMPSFPNEFFSQLLFGKWSFEKLCTTLDLRN